MNRDLTTLNGAAFAVGDAAIQIGFIAEKLLSEQMDWGEAESIFELLRMISVDLHETCSAVHALNDLGEKCLSVIDKTGATQA